MTSLQKGLVGHWTLDAEATSNGTAYDSSAYDNHGNNVNSPTTGQSSVIGESYNFNGTDEHIVLSDIPAFDDSSFNFTVSAWFKTTGSGQILHPRQQYDIDFEVGNTVRLGWYDGSAGSSVSGSTTANDGNWHHAVWQADTSFGEQKVYVDGSLDASDTLTFDPATLNNDNRIARKTSNYYDGNISDVRVYDRVLSANEVSALYNMRSQRQKTNDLAKGLVGYWTMDDADTSGGTLYDSSARGFHGSLTAESNAPTTSQSSVLGEAYDFSSGDNITFPTNPDFPSVWTLTCWIKPQNVANGDWNTLCRGNDHQVILEQNTGELGMYDNSTGNGFQGSGYDGTQLEGIWSHMAVIGSGGTQDYYIDGSFVGFAATQSTTNLNQIGYTGGQSWGLMSNFRLYHRALSQSEISALYNNRT